ncbi:MAG: hypothetical protein RL479_2632 [Verrucomicrobiota bacterium]
MRQTLAILFLLATPASAAEPPPLPEYRAPRAPTPPRIDGRLDDPAWAAAPLAGDFVFTWFKAGTREQTRARLTPSATAAFPRTTASS